jgi:hypothetical protein
MKIRSCLQSAPIPSSSIREGGHATRAELGREKKGTATPHGLREQLCSFLKTLEIYFKTHSSAMDKKLKKMEKP